jgi:serine phosphatase RsbU (regulator of sigma subunit)
MLTLSGKEDACSDFDWSNIASRLNHTKTLHYSMNKTELELEKKVFHLKTLNDVSKEIVFLKDTKDIITRLLLMIMGTYGSTQGIAFLFDEEEATIEVYSERGLEKSIEKDFIQLIDSTGDKSIFDIDHGILFHEESTKDLDNKLLRFLASKEFTLFKPLRLEDKMAGGFALGSKLMESRYNEDDMDMLRTLINQGAISIVNARLFQQQLAQERVTKELEIAIDIQLSFLPSKIATVEGLDLAAVFLPAKEVGGDFYDFIELPENKLGIVIADVVGKGIPAALYMALSRALIRACSAHEPTNLTKSVCQTNILIQECSNADLFVTLFYAIYDPATNKLRYVRAGHNYPILYKKNKNHFITLRGQGTALGVFDEIFLEEKEFDLEEGDIVVFYTDGVTEAINSEREEFGAKRLIQAIAGSKGQSANIIAETIKTHVEDFANEQDQFDDITLVVLKKTVVG